jgi:DNA-binding TFAR19-related protein (PDSD5 family)
MIYLDAKDLSNTKLNDFNKAYIIDNLFTLKILTQLEEVLMSSHWTPTNVENMVIQMVLSNKVAKD